MAKYAKIYDKLNGQPHLQDLIKHQYYSVLDAEDKKIYEEHHKSDSDMNILNLRMLFDTLSCIEEIQSEYQPGQIFPINPLIWIHTGEKISYRDWEDVLDICKEDEGDKYPDGSDYFIDYITSKYGIKSLEIEEVTMRDF